jgi:hypothetical protein
MAGAAAPGGPAFGMGEDALLVGTAAPGGGPPAFVMGEGALLVGAAAWGGDRLVWGAVRCIYRLGGHGWGVVGALPDGPTACSC